ncbi:hypothetical protein ACFVH4_25580 [Nocardia ignorata]|uniref:hypothetical protein n=1 Tax=Nocardia ignorata TaxID=145285 RepID=UPI00362C001B
MSVPGSEDQLGLKVRRAQEALAEIRGVGTSGKVRVVVDANNKLLDVFVPGLDLDTTDAIIAAYGAAVADQQPRIAEATREITADPQFESVSAFVRANSKSPEPTWTEEDEDRYFEEQNRRGWR